MSKYQSQTKKDIWNKGNQQALVQRIFDRHKVAPVRGLSLWQRYIYQHFLYHQSKRTGQPCLLPVYTGGADKVWQFLTALDKLEERGLIVVDRRSADYRRWTISGPR